MSKHTTSPVQTGNTRTGSKNGKQPPKFKVAPEYRTNFHTQRPFEELANLLPNKNS